AAGVTVNLSTSGPQNTGGAGTDTLTSIEYVSGSGHDDILTGRAGNNHISGNAGADIITGLAGGDILTGGAGADTFVYKAVSESAVSGLGRDRISDFLHGTDKIDLSAIDANANFGGNQSFNFLDTAAFTHHPSQLHVVHSGSYTYL